MDLFSSFWFSFSHMRRLFSKSLYVALFSLIVLSISCSVAMAQNYENVQPKKVPNEPSSTEIEQSVPEVQGDDSILVDRLKSVIFLDSVDQLRTGSVPGVGVDVSRVSLLQTEEFKILIDVYMGKPVSIKSLNQLTRDVVLYYRANDRPIVDVIVPEQDITNGTVQLVVLEGIVGDIYAQGNKWFGDELLTRQVRLKKGEVIREKKLVRDIRWLNQNPFRDVNIAFSPGAEMGQTNVIVKTKDRFPVRFYTGYEDTGNNLTGDERLIAGINWGNAFFLDHQLNYQFTMSDDFDELNAHSVSYIAPLPWRHTITAFTSLASSEAKIPGGFRLQGSSAQVGARYNIPLAEIPVCDWGTYRHEFSFGYDWKQSNNQLEFGIPIAATRTDLGQFVFTYSNSLSDPYGVTSFRASLFKPTPGWFDDQNDAEYRTVRGFSSASYTYARFDVDRVTQLPFDFTLSNELTFQVSDRNLLPSEQLGFGGYSSVRGYDERELINTDEGFVLRNEIRTPPIQIIEHLDFLDYWSFKRNLKDQLQFLFFWDYGYAETNHPLPGAAKHQTISSIGPGLRYSINPYLSVRMDYGFQLQQGTATRHASRLHLGVIASY